MDDAVRPGGRSAPDLASLEVRELLALSASCISELRDRGVVRTGNAPLGDYAEWLALQALGGELAPNSERSFDLTTPSGQKVQVKSRRVSTPPRSGQLQSSPFRSWGFDSALFMLLDEHTYEVMRACSVPVEVVQELSRYVPHVNGSNAYMTEDLMGHPDASDMTAQLRSAAGDSPAAESAQASSPSTATRAESRHTVPAEPPIASARVDTPTDTWLWLENGAIKDFMRWRVAHGATRESASSYASGARAYVTYWRQSGTSSDSFETHLRRTRGLTSGAISSYQSHAREFLRYLNETGWLRSRR